MEVTYRGITYKTIYDPFYRIERNADYQVFGIKYPSGYTEELIVYDAIEYLPDLKQYLVFLIKEYLLEEDAMLTPRAIKLKEDINDLFGNP